MDVRLTAEQQQLRDAAAKLADDLARHVGVEGQGATIAIGEHATDTRGYQRALILSGTTVLAADMGAALGARI